MKPEMPVLRTMTDQREAQQKNPLERGGFADLAADG
jgi:hypothetical protein